MKPRVRTAFRSVVSLLACAALALGTPDASATTVVPVTVEQLAARADVVVVATVRSTRALWEGRIIVTDCELEVRVVMKGAIAPGQTVTLRVPGGVLGEIGQSIPGVPRVDRGDTFVAFITRAEDRAPGRYYLTHLTASILPLSSPAPTSATPSGAIVVRPAAEGMIVEPTGSPGPRRAPTLTAAARTAMARSGMPLEQLLALVRGAR